MTDEYLSLHVHVHVHVHGHAVSNKYHDILNSLPYPSLDVWNTIISALSIDKSFTLCQDVVNDTVSRGHDKTSLGL